MPAFRARVGRTRPALPIRLLFNPESICRYAMRFPRPSRSNPARISVAALFALAALGGCLRHENDPGQGGLTIGENKELDEAAAMLDARPKAPTPPTDLPATNPPEDAKTPPQADPAKQKSEPAPNRPSLGGISKASQPKPADAAK